MARPSYHPDHTTPAMERINLGTTMQHGPRNRVSIAVAIIIAAAALLPATEGVQAETAQAYDLDLPSQPLSDALRSLGKKTETNILIDRRLVTDQKAPALKAHLTTDEAIAALLSGTGLRHRFLNEHTVVLESTKTTFN